ncbi:MAG: HmuY family protein [Pseudomonadota bacterium]|nr:HmuY family protein [Pseudomonadota bacterium]
MDDVLNPCRSAFRRDAVPRRTRWSRLKPLLHLPAALLLAACAGDISPDGDPGEPGGSDLPGPGGPQAVFTRHAAGYYQGVVDASGSDWIYLDLDTQTQVFPSDPAASADWDLAHRGVDIKLNGGVSGTPPTITEAAVYADKAPPGTPYAFDEIRAAPPDNAVPYRTDAAGGLLGLGDPAYAMSTYPDADEAPNVLTGAGDHGWYRLGARTSGSPVSVRANVGYVLRTVDCRYYKLRMTAYHDGDGAPRHPQYDFAAIDGPACSGGGDIAPLGRARFTAGSSSTEVTVDASDEDAWVYLDLVQATQVVPASPANDPPGWDLAWRRTDIRLNGGSSGAGSVGVHDILRDDWDTRTAVPGDAEWHTDADGALAMLTVPPREVGGECTFGADGDYGWHYYSGFCDKGNGNHHVSPRDVVYLLRAHDGSTWKLRILSYYDADTGAAAFPVFEYAPVTP